MSSKRVPPSTSELGLTMRLSYNMLPNVPGDAVNEELLDALRQGLQDVSRQRLRAILIAFRRLGNTENCLAVRDLINTFNENKVQFRSRTLKLLQNRFEGKHGINYEALWKLMVEAQSRTGRDSVQAMYGNREQAGPSGSQLTNVISDAQDQDLLSRLHKALQTSDGYDLQVMRSVCQTIDVSQHGLIPKKRFRKICSEQHIPITGPLLTTLLNRCDDEKNGQISWPEFLSLLERAAIFNPSNGPQARPKSVSQSQRTVTLSSIHVNSGTESINGGLIKAALSEAATKKEKPPLKKQKSVTFDNSSGLPNGTSIPASGQGQNDNVVDDTDETEKEYFRNEYRRISDPMAESVSTNASSIRKAASLQASGEMVQSQTIKEGNEGSKASKPSEVSPRSLPSPPTQSPSHARKMTKTNAARAQSAKTRQPLTRPPSRTAVKTAGNKKKAANANDSTNKGSKPSLASSKSKEKIAVAEKIATPPPVPVKKDKRDDVKEENKDETASLNLSGNSTMTGVSDAVTVKIDADDDTSKETDNVDPEKSTKDSPGLAKSASSPSLASSHVSQTSQDSDSHASSQASDQPLLPAALTALDAHSVYSLASSVGGGGGGEKKKGMGSSLMSSFRSLLKIGKKDNDEEMLMMKDDDDDDDQLKNYDGDYTFDGPEEAVGETPQEPVEVPHQPAEVPSQLVEETQPTAEPPPETAEQPPSETAKEQPPETVEEPPPPPEEEETGPQETLTVTVHGKEVTYQRPEAYFKTRFTPDPPKERLQLEWVYGYRGNDCRGNLFEVSGGSEILYFTSNLAVMYNPVENTQRHYTKHTADIRSMAVHSDGVTVVTGQGAAPGESGVKANIHMWKCDTLETVMIFGDGFFEKAVTCLAFSPVQDILLAVDNRSKHMMSVWSVKSGNNLASTLLNTPVVCQASFHPKDPDQIISIGREHLVFWQLKLDEDSTELGTIEQTMTANYENNMKAKYIISMSFRSNGDLITGDSNGTIYIWPTGGNTISHTISHAHEGPVFTLQMIDKKLVSGGRDGFLRCWSLNAKGGDSLGKLQLPKPEGGVRTILHVGGTVYIGTTVNSLLSTTLSNPGFTVTGEETTTCLTQGHYEEVHCLTPLPDGQFLTGSYDGTVSLCNSVDHRPLWRYVVKGTNIHCLDVHNDTNLLVLGTKDARMGQSIVVLTVGQSHEEPEINRFKLGKGAAVCLKISPDGEMTAVGCQDNLILLLKVYNKGSTLEIIGKFKGHNGPITGLDWSKEPMGEAGYLVQSSSDQLDYMIWSSQTQEVVENLADVRNVEWASQQCLMGFQVAGIWGSDEEGPVHMSVDISQRQSPLLAAGGTDGQIRLYRPPCGHSEAQSKSSSAHPHCNVCVRFANTPLPVLLSAGNKDYTIMQWKVLQDSEEK